MPNFLDFKEFTKDLKEVTTSKIIHKKKFHPEGLFSEQIFGPLKNYTCQCNTFHGVAHEGSTCDTCKVDIVNSSERRRRFAKIKLPLPVVNPLFMDMLIELGGSMIKDSLELLMKKETSILYIDDDNELVITSQDGVPTGVKTYERYEAIHILVETICNDHSDGGNASWDIIKDNIDKLFIDEIVVLPPDLRPATNTATSQKSVDRINHVYGQILAKKDTMKNTIIEVERDKTLFYTYYKQLQYAVRELYTFIFSKLSKKEGLIRGNILGKRVDFSGRAVIVPDPTLSVDECSLPYLMVIELFKLQIAKKLVVLGKFKLLNQAIEFIDECYKYNNKCLYSIAKDISEGEYCILNRQPSLHRLGMIAFKINVNLYNVIKIHPMVCPPFNADFDGDQMAVYIPLTDKCRDEIKTKLLMSSNFDNPANGELTTVPTQDIILGIYALTTNLFPKLSEEIYDENKKSLMTKSQKLFNDCLPDDYPVILDSLGEKQLVNIVTDIRDKYSIDIVSEVLDNIKRIGFKYCTLFGTTLSLDSCNIEEVPNIRDRVYTGTISEQLEKISNPNTIEALKENFKYSYLIDSGARGSWDQVRQIILSRGFISNFKGRIIETPIKGSLFDGLEEKEFFNSTNGCRKGLLDVALNTGTSGYLSRKLIFACCNLQLGREIDCGTKDTLEVHISNVSKANMMIGKKFVASDGSYQTITIDNCKSFVGKTLQMRSPIYCKNPLICQTCYGDFHKCLNSSFIGVIAAQSMGECNTQLVLRTFHTSGVAVSTSNNDDMKQQDIVNDLSLASTLLHQFPRGLDPKDLVSSIFEIYNRSRRINHVHFECVVAQLMWKGYQKWRLMDTRENIVPEFHSVQTVPNYESWSLSLAFSNPKKSILRGILYSGKYVGIMDQILMGKKIGGQQ